MSVFFCDSNCELWFEKVNELGIKFISMPYSLNDDVKYYDLGEHTDFVKYFNDIKTGATPKTQALNPYDYTQYFEPVFASGQDILYVHFSHNMSGTFNYMKTAVDELLAKYPERKFTEVDTLSISLGAGMIVYEAAKLHNAGASDDEVVKYVLDNRQNWATSFVVDDLNHLKRGGRISGAAAFMGTMLSIKPILKVSDDGKIVNVSKEMGKKKAMLSMINTMKETAENVADYPIAIVSANADADADFLEEKVREFVGPEATIWRQPVGPVIGCHCGPGTVGIIYHAKHR